jgi:hypothetical protein
VKYLATFLALWLAVVVLACGFSLFQSHHMNHQSSSIESHIQMVGDVTVATTAVSLFAVVAVAFYLYIEVSIPEVQHIFVESENRPKDRDKIRRWLSLLEHSPSYL